MGNHLRCAGCQLGGHPWPSSNPSGNIFAQHENLAVDTCQSGALAESRQCLKPFRHEGYHCRYLSASHLIKPLMNYSGKSRLVLRLELRPFCRALCLLPTPQIPRGTQESGRRKALSREVHHSRLTSSAPLANALCSQVQLPGRLTSHPVPAVPRGMGVAKKHKFLYKQFISLQAAEQRRSRPSQRLRCRHCTRPWTLLGNPAGSWVQLQLECDTECWEGTELYSWAHYSPAMSHAAKLCCRGWYCSVSNLCHSCPSIGAQLQGETR